MKPKTLTILTLLLSFYFYLLSSPSTGQTIQNDVIASGGGHAVTGNIDMEFTIGEPVIETFEETNLTLTQGFHQPSLVLTSIEEPDMLTNISIFPNPVSDELSIEIPADYSSKILYHLFDINGKLLQSGEFYSGSNKLEMHSYATASYVLQISDTSTGRQIQTKIMKIR